MLEMRIRPRACQGRTVAIRRRAVTNSFRSEGIIFNKYMLCFVGLVDLRVKVMINVEAS